MRICVKDHLPPRSGCSLRAFDRALGKRHGAVNFPLAATTGSRVHPFCIGSPCLPNTPLRQPAYIPRKKKKRQPAYMMSLPSTVEKTLGNQVFVEYILLALDI